MQALVKKWKATGPTYRSTHRTVIEAIALIKRYAEKKVHRYPTHEKIPLDGLVHGAWRDAVMEKDQQGRQRVNRITYEICALRCLFAEIIGRIRA